MSDIAQVGFNIFPKVAVFPNPAIDYLTVEIFDDSSRELELTIIDEIGKVVMSKNLLISGQAKVGMNLLSNGSYTLFLKSDLWEESFRFNKVE